MKILFKVLLLLGIVQAAMAGDSETVSAIKDESRTAMVLVRQADYVLMPVIIASEQKDVGLRMSELSEARKLLLKEVKKNGRFQVRSGWFGTGAKVGSFVSYSSSLGGDAQLRMQLLAPLTGSNDFFQAVQDLKQFVDALKPSGKIAFTTSMATITVDNPENYRAELVSKITGDLRAVKQGKVTISGLENPVSVRPINDQEVELSLPYHVVLEMPLQ